MKYSKGFTLIEMIVVMALFLFIIGAAISIFISIVEYQKNILSQQELLNQVSYAEEYMSKALRVATAETNNENCLVDPTSGDASYTHPGYIYLLTRYDSTLGASGLFRGIKFLNQSDVDAYGNPACEEFFLDGSGTTSDPYILKVLKNSNDDSKAVALTPSSLKINFIKFAINGSDGSAENCPDPTQCGASKAENCPDPTQCGASKSDSGQARVTILLNITLPGDNQEPTRTIQTTVSQRNLNAK